MVCSTQRTITWSPRDTDRTIAQVKEHNAALKAWGCAKTPTTEK